jgi:hypothetical protein
VPRSPQLPARAAPQDRGDREDHVAAVPRPRPAGADPGDEFFFGSQFWNADQTQQVGSNRGFCVLQTQTVVHCVGTARLNGGRLEFAGQTSFTATASIIAITGGTGVFDGAEGHVSVHNLNSDGTLSRDVIVLLG